MVREKNLDTWNKPLVVMANSKNILNLKYSPKNYKYKIIKSDSLVEYLKRDLQKCDSDYLINKKIMEKYANTILESYNKKIDIDYIDKYEKELKKYMSSFGKKTTSNNQENYELQIRNNLINYRKKKSFEKGIPAYYIFNNDELEKILELNPKTISNLRDAKILSDVKLKLHGEEIIKIINKK